MCLYRHSRSATPRPRATRHAGAPAASPGLPWPGEGRGGERSRSLEKEERGEEWCGGGEEKEREGRDGWMDKEGEIRGGWAVEQRKKRQQSMNNLLSQ